MKTKIAIIVGVVLVIAGFLFNYFTKQNSITSKNETTEISEANNYKVNRIIVQIGGEVNKPGLYELNSDARIYDLVTLAGWFTSKADSVAINLASTLKDGDYIIVGAIIKESNPQSPNNASKLISINKATKEELMQLEGIGEAKANNIITYRSSVKPFYQLEDLMNVSGISQTIYDKIKAFITL